MTIGLTLTKHLRQTLLFICLFSIAAVAQERPKLGLALSGGSARGLAHIGVIKAFEENHIPIDIIGGTSAGAIIGGLYAAGVSLEEFKEWELNQRLPKAVGNQITPQEMPLERRFQNLPSQYELYFNRNKFMRSKSILSDNGIYKLLTYGLAPGNFAANGDFDNLVIPFRALTAELIHRRVKVLKSGSLMAAIRKSSAFPIIYEPVKEDSLLYVDGGIYNNLPIQAVRDAGADYIVAVNVATPTPRYGDLNDLQTLAAYYMNVFAARSDSNSVSGWDTFINISLSDINLLDFHRGTEAIQAGYEAGLKAVPKIKREFPYDSNPDLVHMKQHILRHALDDRRIAKIEITGIKLLSQNQVFKMLPIKVGDTLNFAEDLEKIYRLQSNSFINAVEVDFTQAPNSEDVVLGINIIENLKMRFTGGFYFDRSAGMNIYGSVENRRLFRTAIYNQMILYLGNFHSGFTVGLSHPQLLRYELLQQQLGMQVMLGSHIYQYDSGFDGVDFITDNISEAEFQVLSLVRGVFQVSGQLSYRDFRYLVPGGKTFQNYLKNVPEWSNAGVRLASRGSYVKYQFGMMVDDTQNDIIAVPQGLKTGILLIGGITRPNLRALQIVHTPLSDALFNRLEAYGSAGGLLTSRFGASFTLQLSRMLGDPFLAPLTEWVEPWEGALGKYSLTQDMLMKDQVTMITDLIYNPGVRNAWIHLSFFQAIGNNYNFNDLTALQTRDNVGVELALKYDTPIGPLIYGFSWVEKSGWTGQSYARIGWTF